MKIEIELSKPPGGACNFISWRRLVEQLRAAGEIRDKEEVISLQITDDGIIYAVRSR